MATQLATQLSAPPLAATLPPERRPAEWPRSVIAPVNYLDPAGPRPVAYMYDPPPGTPLRTGNYVERRVAIEDLRGANETLSLDVQGFALVPHATAVASFTTRPDQAAPPRRGRARVRDATGAARVIAFDHNCRAQRRQGREAMRPGACASRCAGCTTTSPRARDHTRARLELEARGLAKDEIDRLLAHRFALVNCGGRSGDRARHAAGTDRRARHRAARPRVAGPGLSRPHRRDLRGHRPRRIAGFTRPRCSATRRC
jgi:hypothetical protein